MNLDNIIHEGKPLSQWKSHKDALLYLNSKFAHFDEEEAKLWLTKHGTVLSDKQFQGVFHDIIVKTPPITDPDPMLIWYIEEILETLAKLWGIKSSTYTG